MRLFVMLLVGLILIEMGLAGKPGSILGSLIDPSNMQEGS